MYIHVQVQICPASPKPLWIFYPLRLVTLGNNGIFTNPRGLRFMDPQTPFSTPKESIRSGVASITNRHSNAVN